MFDHTPTRVTLKTEVMQQAVTRAGRPIGIESDKHCYVPKAGMTREERNTVKKQAENSYDAVAKVFGKDISTAIENADVEEAHRIWRLVAEMWLYLRKTSVVPKDPA